MPCLRAFIGLGLSICASASAEVRVSHSTRPLSAGWTEHLYHVVQTSGPGNVKTIEFGPLFADGSAMTSRAESSYPVLVAPAGWIPFLGQHYLDKSDTVWLGFHTLPQKPGLAAGERAVFKVYTQDERFKQEMEFACFATVILSNFKGITRKGQRFPSDPRFVFSQAFNTPRPGYDSSMLGKPEAWGFTGAHWNVYKVKKGVRGPDTALSSIDTELFELPAKAPGATLDYSLQSPAFPKPIIFAPGISGFIARFALEFQDGWSKQDAFSLCLEDSRKGEKTWCLRVLPLPKKSGNRFSRLVSLKASSGQGATATVKPGEDAPKEEDLPDGEDLDATGWWAFQIEFTPSGDVRVLARPHPSEKFQSLFSFRYPKQFRFDRLVVTYRTATERPEHHGISLDDFLVIPTTP